MKRSTTLNILWQAAGKSPRKAEPRKGVGERYDVSFAKEAVTSADEEPQIDRFVS